MERMIFILSRGVNGGIAVKYFLVARDLTLVRPVFGGGSDPAVRLLPNWLIKWLL